MTTSTAHYELKSELARWSLVSRRSQADRRLSWINSICALFLFVGLVGARTHPPPPRTPPPMEEAAPVVVEPLPPPALENTQSPEQIQPDQTPTAPVIVVPNSPSVNFSVPTVGSLVAPMSMAQAPPAELRLREQAPPPIRPTFLQTGAADRPAPDAYPPGAKMLKQEGTVVLLMTGDAAGNILTVDLKQTSGSPILDHAAEEWVRRHWKLPTGQPGRQFEAGIQYLLMR